MGFQIFNFEDNSNVSVVSRKGMFKVIQYDKDLSCTADDAQIKFYMSKMNVKKRQLMITLNNESVNIQPGAMQWYVGDVHQSTGLKGIGDTIKKFFNAQVTGESTIKPQYEGTGVIVTEPSYKHYIIEDLDDWNGAMCVEDGLYCASETKVNLSTSMIKSVSGQTIGDEGLFNLCLKGSGKVVLECNVPQEELITIDLHNDTLKIDGSFAIAWSENLDFTVERSGKTLIGSAVSGEGLVNVYRGTGRVLIKPQV